MTEMTLTVSVPVDVSRDALAMWVAGMLNMPQISTGRINLTDVSDAELDLLDEMDGDVDVTWEASDGHAIES